MQRNILFAIAFACVLTMPGQAQGYDMPPGVPRWHVPNGNTGTEPLPNPPNAIIYENGVGGAVTPGARRPPIFTIRQPIIVTQIMTYHYNLRQRPGTIGLKREDGTLYGPWNAAGAGGPTLPNVYWWVQPLIILQPGRYSVVDSDPNSWSIEASTQGAGIVKIWMRYPDPRMTTPLRQDHMDASQGQNPSSQGQSNSSRGQVNSSQGQSNSSQGPTNASQDRNDPAADWI